MLSRMRAQRRGKNSLTPPKRLLSALVPLLALTVFAFLPSVHAQTSLTNHIVVIAFENTDYKYIVPSGSSDSFIQSLLPYSTALDLNAYCGNDHSCGSSGPTSGGCSAGCYTSVTAGNEYGVSDGVASGSVSATSIFDNLGTNWQAYCENGCPRGADHFPCLQFATTYQSSQCTTMSGSFNDTANGAVDPTVAATFNSASPPAFIWLTPDDNDNMHDTGVSYGDTFLRCFLVGCTGSLTSPVAGSLLTTSLFTTFADKTSLVLWWDEPCNGSSCAADNNPGPFNKHDKAVIFYGPTVKTRGAYATAQYQDFDTLLTIENNLGLSCLSQDCSSAYGADLSSNIFISATGGSGTIDNFPAVPLYSDFSVAVKVYGPVSGTPTWSYAPAPGSYSCANYIRVTFSNPNAWNMTATFDDYSIYGCQATIILTATSSVSMATSWVGVNYVFCRNCI